MVTCTCYETLHQHDCTIMCICPCCRPTQCGSSSCWAPTRTSPTRCCWSACAPAARLSTPSATRCRGFCHFRNGFKVKWGVFQTGFVNEVECLGPHAADCDMIAQGVSHVITDALVCAGLTDDKQHLFVEGAGQFLRGAWRHAAAAARPEAGLRPACTRAPGVTGVR
jgi:hypothetical protein